MTPAAVVAFVLLASDLPTKPAGEPRSAKELYNAWRWYGLPLPPEGTKLIRREDKHDTDTRVRLQLRLRPPTPPRPALVREGTSDWEEFRPSLLRTVRPTADLLKEWDEQWASEWLALSAQAWHLGWAEFAEEAFREGRGWKGIGNAPPASENPKHVSHVLQWTGWWHARHALTDPGSDRQALLTWMLRAADDAPPGMSAGPHAEVVRRLRLTLRPSSAPPGSMESLVNGLTDEECYWSFSPEMPAIRCQLQLIERGFEAVPALIAHLSDDRLTRTRLRLVCGNNATALTGLVTVGDYCRDHLDELSASHIGARMGDERTPGGYLQDYQRAAREWFQAAARDGEEAWAVRHVLPRDRDNPTPVNDHLLRLIRAKYPQHLPGLYRSLLAEWPEHSSWQLAAELAHSRLPLAERTATLRDAFRHTRFTHRLGVIKAFTHLDPAESRRLLVRALDDLTDAIEPNKPALLRDVRWDLIRTNDPTGWAAFVRCHRALSPGGRIVALRGMLHLFDTREPERVREPLKLLATALADPAVHRSEEAGEPEIAVQNFAALELAAYLDIDIPSRPDRTPAEWAAVRADVRAALDRYRAELR